MFSYLLFSHQNGKKRQFGKCKSVRVICSSGAARSTNHFDWLQLHLMDMIVQKCNFFTTKTIVFKGKNISWLYCIHSRWWFLFHLTMKVASRAYSVIFTSLKVLIGQNTPECQRLWVLLRKHFQNAKPSWYQCLDSCPEHDNGSWHKNSLSLQWVVARGQSFLSHSSLKWQDEMTRCNCSKGLQCSWEPIQLPTNSFETFQLSSLSLLLVTISQNSFDLALKCKKWDHTSTMPKTYL